MASAPYDNRNYAKQAAAAPRDRSVGEHAFIWIAWALAAAFWGASLTTMAGILEAVTTPTPGVSPDADFGGVAWMLIDVVGGIFLLGGALAYGSMMYARRNRALDRTAEVATANLYNTIERQGGEDMTSRSPDQRRP